MADPWVRPTSPGLPDPGDSPRPEDVTRPLLEKSPSEDDYLLIDRLREDAAAGRMDLSSILSEVTHAARYFTDSTGAALALWSQGVVICRARSGDTAPPLGTKLDVDSGVSGECMRTGQAQRCQDAFTDLRVDSELCTEMGIRSLAVVPLNGTQGVIGILEVFSDRANAFSEAHVTLLKKLAQIAVTSRAKSVKVTETASFPPLPATATNVVRLPPQEPREPFAFLPARMRGEEGQRLRVAAAALLLLIMGIAGWLVMRTRSGQARGNQSAHAATRAVPELMAADNSSESVATNAGQQVSLTLAGPVKPRADLAAGEVVRKAASSIVEREAAAGAISSKSEAPAVSPPPNAPEPDAPAPDPSEAISGMSQATAMPQAVANPQPVFPFVAVPVSQGVTGGKLTHRVDPVYPAEGRLQHVEGAVVLDALVGEDGRVKQVRVTSGSPTLARAAMDAVRQWRYEPYLLNGRPVALHNQITIQFKLP